MIIAKTAFAKVPNFIFLPKKFINS